MRETSSEFAIWCGLWIVERLLEVRSEVEKDAVVKASEAIRNEHLAESVAEQLHATAALNHMNPV